MQLVAENVQLQQEVEVEQHEQGRRQPVEGEQGQADVDDRQAHRAAAQQLIVGGATHRDRQVEAERKENDVEVADVACSLIGRGLQPVGLGLLFGNP